MKEIFTPPVVADERKTQTTRLLYIYLWTFMLAATVMILVATVSPEITMRQLLFIGTADASSLLLLILTRRGYTRLVSWMVVVQLWVITTALVSTGGGVHSPEVTLYLIVVLIGGLLMGERAGLVIAGFCLITELMLVRAELADTLLPSIVQQNALTLWIFNMAAMIIIVAIQYFASSTFRGSLNRMYQELDTRQRIEAALRESEEKYRLTFENASDVIFTVNADFSITNISPSVEKLLGHKPETFIGRSISDLSNILTPESLEKALSQGAQLMAGKTLHRSSFDFIAMDGTQKNLELRGSSLVHNGNITGMVVVARDITEQKRAEEALQDQAEQYSAILGTTSDGFWLVDDKGRLLDVNHNYCRMSGYNREELLQLTIPDLDVAENAEITKHHIHKVIQDGSDRFESRHRTKDGRLFDVEVSTTFLASKGLIVFIRDITKRKAAEEALRDSEKKYREILDNIDDGFYEVDLAGCFTFFNDILPQFLGYTHKELLQTDFKTAMDEENAQKVYNVFHGVYQTGIPVRLVEWESRKRDGSRVYVESSVSLIRNADGTPVGFRGVVRDITERRQFLDRLQTMAITDQLTGLFNRRGFITLTEQQLKSADRTKKKVLLAFIDVDGMKHINDIWGHEEGDRALVNATKLLKQSFRESDIIARIGGDEFAVLAPDVTDAMQTIFISRLHQQMDEHNAEAHSEYRISLSVGSTFYEPYNPCSLDELISRADKLMYEDKRCKVT
ncbi:MAG: PAS domain S-box protein [Deltaproteobacteria bacterium]|nr:PAS domain S-box protein [Deltaproteobacteria bacterium]